MKRKILALGAAALIVTNIVSVTAGRPYACQPSTVQPHTPAAAPASAGADVVATVDNIATNSQRAAVASVSIGQQLGDYASKLVHQTCW